MDARKGSALTINFSRKERDDLEALAVEMKRDRSAVVRYLVTGFRAKNIFTEIDMYKIMFDRILAAQQAKTYAEFTKKDGKDFIKLSNGQTFEVDLFPTADDPAEGKAPSIGQLRQAS